MSPNGPAETTIVDPETLALTGPRRSGWRGALILLLLALGLGGSILYGIRLRLAEASTLAALTEAAAVPSVAVTHPTAGAPNQELVLPGNAQAITDTPIFARTNGYLKRWTVDIGGKVKKGQLLAEIDTPEVDEQLRQARADLASAEATLSLAAVTAERDEALLKSRSIATQERDNAVGARATASASVAAHRADVARLERLQSYERIEAPFDGVITARNTDVGALVDAGANSVGRELFHLSAIDKIRVFVTVPEAEAAEAKPGAVATVTFDAFPGEKFPGTLTRTTGAIDPVARTLLVEVDLDNPTGRLMPGAYGFVHLTLDHAISSVTVPSNTLIFRKEGSQVAVIRDNKAVLVPVKIGRDYGEKVEILTGLSPADQVILDPSDSLISDTLVQIVAPKG